MKMRSMVLTGLTAAILGLTACTANVTVPNLTPGGGGGQVTSAVDAYDVTQSDPQVKQLNDLQLYRCELDESSGAWVLFYFSPSQNKSYRCTESKEKKVVLTEVQEADLMFKPEYKIDKSQWKVDSVQAQQKAVQVVQQVVNVNVTITDLTLLSAAQFQQLTGITVQNPVWVCKVQAPPPSASPSASPSAAPSASPSTAPSASPSAMPSASPTAAPSASPSATTGGTTIVNNITNVYIDANSGNQIQVGGTGNTQTSTSGGSSTTTTNTQTNTTTTM